VGAPLDPRSALWSLRPCEEPLSEVEPRSAFLVASRLACLVFYLTPSVVFCREPLSLG
jgi:hypothetical protein